MGEALRGSCCAFMADQYALPTHGKNLLLIALAFEDPDVCAELCAESETRSLIVIAE